MYKILIVEDEKPISDLLRMSLRDAGYSCTCAFDGAQAVSLLDTQAFDLALLDIMLPEIDGYDLLGYIRPLEIPVIFITAKNSTEDKVRGLRAGADDYLAKPFEIIELLARVESVLRRYYRESHILEICGLCVDTQSRIVSRNGQPISLTKKEYDLLLLFIRNKNIALFRDVIYEKVWHSDYLGDSRTIDLHVQRLRRKVGWEEKLVSIYKVGYRLECT